jgi:hypothetical protein
LCSTTELHPRRTPKQKGLHLREPLADGIIQDETPCKRQMALATRDFPGFFFNADRCLASAWFSPVAICSFL